MSKSRNFQIIGAIVLIIAATLVTISAVKAPAVAPLNLSWPPRPDFSVLVQQANIPITGDQVASDFYARHPELSERAGAAVDMSDYALRHMDLNQATGTADTSDYFLRH